MTTRAQSVVRALRIFVAVIAFTAAAQTQAERAPLPSNANDLVRTVVANELKHVNDGNLYAFKQRTQKPKGSTTKQMVETPQGVIGRLIAINDKPLSAEERRKDDERINRLLDPRQMRDKAKEQKEDEDRTTKMVRSLPDAFIYSYDGEAEGNLVKMKFTPNPNFDPPSKETLVFQGMAGEMVVDVRAMRIAKIDGTMQRDVNIGWGILGRLDKGGHFYVEQAEVAPGHWDSTKLTLNFTGKALFFKTIRISQTDTLSDFQPVQPMNVAQALDFLRKHEEQVAESKQQAQLGR